MQGLQRLDMDHTQDIMNEGQKSLQHTAADKNNLVLSFEQLTGQGIETCSVLKKGTDNVLEKGRKGNR